MDESLIKARHSPPLLSVGKRGLSNHFINELEEQLKKNKYIKIKILKNSPFESRKEVFVELSEKVDYIELIEIRGWTVIVARKAKRRKEE